MPNHTPERALGENLVPFPIPASAPPLLDTQPPDHLQQSLSREVRRE